MIWIAFEEKVVEMVILLQIKIFYLICIFSDHHLNHFQGTMEVL